MSDNGLPRPENTVVVLFGATGDLAKRKLLPGLYHLYVAGLLPEKFRVIGSSPSQFALSDDDFRAHALDAVSQFCNTKPSSPTWDQFAAALSFGAASAPWVVTANPRAARCTTSDNATIST